MRECAAQLVRFAKTRQVATLLVGHVTKEGTLAGPRVLEHMVDTVLYFESDLGSRFRIVRAVKNRFGAANEMGFFVMAEEGFREVKNPSAIFLARHGEPVPGSVTLVTREGTRPVLVEVQALVDPTQAQTPRRLAQGFDGQRMGLLLAVLHRHCGIALGQCDVFANIVGGLRVSETAVDLAVALAVVSSLRERRCRRTSSCSAKWVSPARCGPCRSARSGCSRRRSTVSAARSCRARTCRVARSISRSWRSIV